jgi:hypothetical protein
MWECPWLPVCVEEITRVTGLEEMKMKIKNRRIGKWQE